MVESSFDVKLAGVVEKDERIKSRSELAVSTLVSHLKVTDIFEALA